ncbi:MAG: CpaF family protein [Alphaproteobacteria bacterium]
MSFGRRSDGTPVVSGRENSSRGATPRARENIVSFAEAGHVDPGDGADPGLEPAQFVDMVVAAVREGDAIQDLPRGEVAALVTRTAEKTLGRGYRKLNQIEQRNLITQVLNQVYTAPVRDEPAAAEPAASLKVEDVNTGNEDPAHEYSLDGLKTEKRQVSKVVEDARRKVQPELVERIDVGTAVTLPREELEAQIADIVTEILHEEKLQLNQFEQQDLVKVLLDEMLGLGPLEPLLADEDITDIMVNGYDQIYIERFGKLELTDIAFRDNKHVMNIATRIVSHIGRRIDETNPLVDARLADGSRVNIIIPPLAIDGPSISIRKFAKKKITLDVMEAQNNLSTAMAKVMRIAGRAQLNILISGGTGSGKTTLLNALSQMIDHGERVVTIEDAAELQLQQPHVVRLETRPANLEGHGAITMRDLVKNALRMRPDRIILGEVRGSEAVDMLQAMNTGHEGSMCTVHANRPREALTRLENMVGMAGINLPAKAVRTQIAAALDIIVQVSRMRDGVRRITHVMEVVGMEGDVVTTQDLFVFKYEGDDPSGRIMGTYEYSGVRPHLTTKAEYFGLGRALTEALR